MDTPPPGAILQLRKGQQGQQVTESKHAVMNTEKRHQPKHAAVVTATEQNPEPGNIEAADNEVFSPIQQQDIKYRPVEQDDTG